MTDRETLELEVATKRKELLALEAKLNARSALIADAQSAAIDGLKASILAWAQVHGQAAFANSRGAYAKGKFLCGFVVGKLKIKVHAE